MFFKFDEIEYPTNENFANANFDGFYSGKATLDEQGNIADLEFDASEYDYETKTWKFFTIYKLRPSSMGMEIITEDDKWIENFAKVIESQFADTIDELVQEYREESRFNHLEYNPGETYL